MKNKKCYKMKEKNTEINEKGRSKHEKIKRRKE